LKQGTLKRLLREPLFHFIAIGGLFFYLYSLSNDISRRAADVINISPARISQIRNGFETVWKRPPGEGELKALIENEIREEVYYRDALALGLDKNDAMVRRRLVQKMEFLGDSGAYLKQPAKDELERYYQNHQEKYQRSAKRAFEQIFLGEQVDKIEIRDALQVLQSGASDDGAIPGRPSRLPAQLRLSPRTTVDSIFGDGFFEQISQLPPGKWSGPVQSNYGIHLVRTLGEQAASLPPLESIREAVLKDWQTQQAGQARKLDYARRRARYRIEINSQAVDSL